MIGRRFPWKPRGYLGTPRPYDVSTVHSTDVVIFYAEIIYKTHEKVTDRTVYRGGEVRVVK